MAKARDSQKSIYFCFSLCLCRSQPNCGKLLKRWEYQTTLTRPLRKPYMGQEATVRTGQETLDWFKIEKGGWQGWILSPCLFKYHSEHIMQMPAWNQDCQEKYLQPQLCRWYHSNSTKWRGTNEPADEGVRSEWKRGLKTQHAKN